MMIWSYGNDQMKSERVHSKKSKNSDNNIGDYSSFNIAKIYFQKKSLCNFLVKKWKVPYQNTTFQFQSCWSRVLDIQNHTFFHWFWMENVLIC